MQPIDRIAIDDRFAWWSVLTEIADHEGFFHWELEFAQVFVKAASICRSEIPHGYVLIGKTSQYLLSMNRGSCWRKIFLSLHWPQRRRGDPR